MATLSSGPRPSDRWIPWYFFGFFTLLVLVLVPMCIIAVRTDTGVVTQNAYDKGLAYNKLINAAEQQQALQWRGDLTVDEVDPQHVKVRFVLRDATGKPLDGADVKVWFVRPTQSKMDQVVVMHAQTDGVYAADIALPASGVWDVRVSALDQGQNYQVSKRIILQ